MQHEHLKQDERVKDSLEKHAWEAQHQDQAAERSSLERGQAHCFFTLHLFLTVCHNHFKRKHCIHTHIYYPFLQPEILMSRRD